MERAGTWTERAGTQGEKEASRILDEKLGLKTAMRDTRTWRARKGAMQRNVAPAPQVKVKQQVYRDSTSPSS